MKIAFVSKSAAWKPTKKFFGSSRFKAPWAATLKLLEDECWHLFEKLRRETKREPDVLIELAVRPDEIRIDGALRGDARPSERGAAVVLTTPTKTLRFYTDAFSDWRQNVRAIALGLEALRKVERYGIAAGGEQYTGYTALPEPEPGLANLDQAAAWLATVGGGDADRIRTDAEYAKEVYRRAVKAVHPDTNANCRDGVEFKRVIRSAEILGIR